MKETIPKYLHRTVLIARRESHSRQTWFHRSLNAHVSSTRLVNLIRNREKRRLTSEKWYVLQHRIGCRVNRSCSSHNG